MNGPVHWGEQLMMIMIIIIIIIMVHWGEHLMMMMIIVMAKVGLVILLPRWYVRRVSIINPGQHFCHHHHLAVLHSSKTLMYFFLLKLALYLKVDNTQTWKYRFSVICESKT